MVTYGMRSMTKRFSKILADIIDRATGKEGLTMAGLMMFGKGLSVQERFANFRMDYLDFCNLIGDERYSDRLTYDGRWENNLYQFFSRVLPKVTADLPRPFRMEGVQEWMTPHNTRPSERPSQMPLYTPTC